MAMVMGTTNMISTLMKTAYALLLDTCFYIMAIAVVCGALGSLFTEFGVVAMLKLMRFNLSFRLIFACVMRQNSRGRSF